MNHFYLPWPSFWPMKICLRKYMRILTSKARSCCSACAKVVTMCFGILSCQMSHVTQLFVFNWGGMKPRWSLNKGIRPNPFIWVTDVSTSPDLSLVMVRHLVPGHLVPGHLVPGHLVPGHLVLWCYCIQRHLQRLYYKAELTQKDFKVNKPVWNLDSSG